MANLTSNDNPTPLTPQANLKVLGVICSIFLGAIALFANLSQISGLSILTICKDYDLAGTESLCKQIKNRIAFRRIPSDEKLPKFLSPSSSEQPEFIHQTPSSDEKLPKFLSSPSSEQPEFRFERSF
ncbi:MAG: hypothetical protein HC836_29495 [Richelia sp. RM2_1_2]|nr:hypothetical protein [Richelia sp. RM2_1_2]